MNFRHKQNQPQAGFQMAPMIDIMFLLLIFFMAAAVYAQWETKVGITVPSASSGKQGAREPGEIIINIDAAGAIFVNDTEMSTARLAEILARVAKQYRDQPVIIRADAKTAHEDVVAVLDICRVVDIWNVAFAALPKKTP